MTFSPQGHTFYWKVPTLSHACSTRLMNQLPGELIFLTFPTAQLAIKGLSGSFDQVRVFPDTSSNSFV